VHRAAVGAAAVQRASMRAGMRAGKRLHPAMPHSSSSWSTHTLLPYVFGRQASSVERYTRRVLLVALSAAAGVGAGEVPVLWHVEAQVEVYRKHGPECHDSALTVLYLRSQGTEYAGRDAGRV
jgi:hypothetical protein